MTKRLHPIRKLVRACQDHHVERIVKPLLDALTKEHEAGWRTKDSSRCEVCRLLAAWKEPIR